MLILHCFSNELVYANLPLLTVIMHWVWYIYLPITNLL